MAKKGKKGYLPVVIGAAVAVVIGVILISRYGDVVFKTTLRPAAEKTIDVYFGSVDGLGLQAERTSIKKGAIEEELGEALNALVKGPANKDLDKTLPDGTRITGIRVEGHTAVIDLSVEISANHAGGSSGEIQTVYSIVNTAALNFPGIKDVHLLVDGKKAETIAGHIDISRPLTPDSKVIQR